MKTIAMIGLARATAIGGLLAVRAEAQPKKPDSIEALATAFEAFKETHTASLDEIKAGKTDVVTTEKLGKIEADLDKLQEAVEKVNLAASLGDGHDSAKPRDPEYTQEFQAYFKGGSASAKLEELRAAATKTDGEGGYLAPIEWDRTISKKTKVISPMRQNSSVITISGAGFKKVYSDGVVGSGWVGETAARPQTTTPGLSTLSFTMGEIYANPAASQGLIDDAEIDIEAWLADEVSVEFDKQEGIAFLSGDGSNKPDGVLTYIEGAANAAKHPYGAIPALLSGAAADVKADALFDLQADLPAEFLPNAKFFMNRGSQASFRKLKTSDGAYLWQPSLALGVPPTLAGEPVVDMPGMPNVGAGNIAALYGDMAETYQVIDRIGVRVLRDPYTAKPFVLFYTTKRVGGGVKNPTAMRALKIGAA
ncbi:phage major capsid protein [Sphingobium lactosutens]|uniref:Capsid protein n=1 Tax=Sphingobium lactosutens DS20 TaxID=1331060 RepID=T0HA64_9SPHN|nr:phage major capsid protein [Sphingobium lactosutens]EQB13221.1 capsid protein [Sphingobium lactosutens DS20]